MLSLGTRKSGRAWSWHEARDRIVAAYQSTADGRLRTAVLLWQGDDPRVPTEDGRTPALLVFTMDLDPGLEPGAGNAVELAGFDSLEQARRRCIEWTGAPTEVDPQVLGETEQIGVFATIREPSFADRG